MEYEYEVLIHLHDQAQTTQRKIASRTGLSLGAVNLLLKRMVRKGLIKIEKITPRTVRYILTPQGMKEKARLTYQYLRRSYRQIIEITGAVEALVSARQGQFEEPVILYGPADEVEQILKSCLRDLGLNFRLCRPEQGPPPLEEKQLVLTWRTEEEEKLPNRAINILNLV